MKRLIYAITIVLSALWFVGCGSKTSTTIPPPTSTITSVTPSCNPAVLQLPQSGSSPTSQCSATVRGTGNFSSAVTWSVSAGSISLLGVFTPPVVTSQTNVNITAISVQDTTKSGSTTVTVNPPQPTITSVIPTCSPAVLQLPQSGSSPTSQCTASVQGTGTFNSAVTWTASTGTITGTGLYAAPTVTASTPVTITATSVQDPTESGQTTVTVNPPPPVITVSISPQNPTVASGATLQFTATVTGTPDQRVIWFVNGIGKISTDGLFTAPNVGTNTTTIVTAEWIENLVIQASTTVTVETICASVGSKPTVILNTPPAGENQLSGFACNVDTTKIKVVIYALTNQWYVQPYVDAPFTNISSDGSWTNSTNYWKSLVILLVDPTIYAPAATEITNPALDPNVIAWTMYPPGAASVQLSGYPWGIKMTGDDPSDHFDPGPNFWSNDPSVVYVATDGLHLKINQINGIWQCAEVYLTKSLGYGTYTVQVASRLDQLDLSSVAAPLFIYDAPGQELDNEYSGMGGLIPSPYNAQFVVQPYTVAGNIVQYVQPSTSQFTTQMEWRADHVTFVAWNGWAAVPAPGDIIYQWTYTGAYIPPVGNERVHINLWLLNGNAPVSGAGDEMIINSFTYQP